MITNKRSLEGMLIVLSPIEVPAFTDETGYYLDHRALRAAELTTIIVQPQIIGYDLDGEGSINIDCRYADARFSTDRFGHVYTNTLFEREINARVKSILGCAQLPDFTYTEQGMQTADYISMEAGTAWSDHFETLSNHALLALTEREKIEEISLGDFAWTRAGS